jgi:uncharacterized protein (TIGR02391 family)
MSDALSFFERFARKAKNYGTLDPSETQDVHPFDERNIHPDIAGVSQRLFDDGHYSHATFEAFKLIDNLVQSLTGIPETGHKLMMNAFNEVGPKIQLNDLQTLSDKDEQFGFRFVFAGSMSAIRNSRGTTTIGQTPSISASTICPLRRFSCARWRAESCQGSSMSSAHIYLSPVSWTHTIQTGKDGRCTQHATAQCGQQEDTDFRVSNGDSLARRVVHLSIMAGQPTEANGSLLEGGVGRLFYLTNSGETAEPFVHGWLFLDHEAHASLLQQLTSGAFSDSTVDLTVEPIAWDAEDPVLVIDRGPLLITAVQLRFSRAARPTPPPVPQGGMFGRRR